MSVSVSVSLETIRACLDGVIPGTLATCDTDGTPNIAYLAQVQYVDASHVALSNQFFNKTRRNLLANPNGVLAVIDPATGAHYRLHVEYLRSETSGALFDSLKARSGALASHAGMTDVFPLQGADIFGVRAVTLVPGQTLSNTAPPRNMLSSLRRATDKIRLEAGLEALLSDALAALESEFGIAHSMALLYDEASQTLGSVASRGYGDRHPNAAIALGAGVIGVAARERTPIRIGHMTSEYAYHRAIRASTVEHGFGAALEAEVPLPGLLEPRSQMALPMLGDARLIGVLYVESTQDLRFSFEDEDALAVLAGQLGQDIEDIQSGSVAAASVETRAEPACHPQGEPLVVKHFSYNDSVFLGEDYLIKGVAGSIFVALVADCIETGRTEFTNRELRLDARIRLPGVSDNLEARLLLLSRRLDEYKGPVRIEKTGRGRFRLCSERPLKLVEG
jgi:adenylate cyclase